MAAEWSHDFCLTCDKQLEHGAYCSQACRLADLDKAVEPASSYTSAASSFPSSTTAGAASSLYLSCKPAIASAPASPSLFLLRQQYFAPSSPSAATDSGKPDLTSSSSQTSLTSMSVCVTQGISSEAWSQLRSYANAFDPVRDIRRRKQSA